MRKELDGLKEAIKKQMEPELDYLAADALDI
jgi:hypothetical protein